MKIHTPRLLHQNKSLTDFEFVKVADFTKSNCYDDSDLGKGAYGRVKLVKDKINGKLYAMKIV